MFNGKGDESSLIFQIKASYVSFERNINTVRDIVACFIQWNVVGDWPIYDIIGRVVYFELKLFFMICFEILYFRLNDKQGVSYIVLRNGIID